MVHHQADISLREMVKTGSFGKYPADELMVIFSGPLLVRGGGITVKDPGTVVKFSIDLQSDRVREFTSVIAQQDREKLHEPVRAEFPIEPFDHIKNGSRSIPVPEESEHELAFDKVERQQNFSAFAALNRIHLNKGTVRPSFQEREEVLISTSDAAGLIDLEGIMGGFSGFIEDFPGEVDVPGGEDTGINVIINGLFGEHDLVRIVDTDVMDRLPFSDQRGNKSIQLKSFLFRDTDTGTGLRAYDFVFMLGCLCRVDMFFQSTVFPFCTAIADIRRSGKSRTILLEIIGAVKMAFGAEAAFFKVTGSVRAKSRDGAAAAVGAIIEGMPKAACFLEDDMVADLLGNGSAVTIQASADLFKGSRIIEHGLDRITFF